MTRHPSPRRAFAARPGMVAVSVAALAAGALLAGACGGRSLFTVPPPKLSGAATSTTEPADLSQVALSRVSGSTTTTVQVQGGTATLNGSVQGPDGPVPGAMVHAERLVGDGVGAADVPTQPDGTWQLTGVRGGRYRLRAWRAPDLAMVTPQIFFLGATDTKTTALRLDRYNGPALAASIAPNPPIVESPANLVISLGTSVVDNQGVVRSTPISAATVLLNGPGAWSSDTPNPTTTTSSGRASWEIVCHQGGTNPLSVSVAGTAPDGTPISTTFPLDLPQCAEPPPPTTEPPPTTTSAPPPTLPPPTTTTTRPRTTTTTKH